MLHTSMWQLINGQNLCLDFAKPMRTHRIRFVVYVICHFHFCSFRQQQVESMPSPHQNYHQCCCCCYSCYISIGQELLSLIHTLLNVSWIRRKSYEIYEIKLCAVHHRCRRQHRQHIANAMSTQTKEYGVGDYEILMVSVDLHKTSFGRRRRRHQREAQNLVLAFHVYFTISLLSNMNGLFTRVYFAAWSMMLTNFIVFEHLLYTIFSSFFSIFGCHTEKVNGE